MNNSHEKLLTHTRCIFFVFQLSSKSEVELFILAKLFFSLFLLYIHFLLFLIYISADRHNRQKWNERKIVIFWLSRWDTGKMVIHSKRDSTVDWIVGNSRHAANIRWVGKIGAALKSNVLMLNAATADADVYLAGLWVMSEKRLNIASKMTGEEVLMKCSSRRKQITKHVNWC